MDWLWLYIATLTLLLVLGVNSGSKRRKLQETCLRCGERALLIVHHGFWDSWTFEGPNKGQSAYGLHSTAQCKQCHACFESFHDEWVEVEIDLSLLFQSYMKENPEKFLDPTTVLEFFRARRTHDSIQPFDGLMLNQEAASDARLTDRKCPICTQPAPNYRNTCKRCGYPYGRSSSH